MARSAPKRCGTFRHAGMPARRRAALAGRGRAVDAGAGSGTPGGLRVTRRRGNGAARVRAPQSPRSLAVPALAGAAARPGPGHGGCYRGALIAVYHDDHQTAERYRESLDQADGRYFQAEPLAEEDGDRGGVAFGYEGSPSWILVTVDPAHRDDVTRGELLTRDGRTIPLPSVELDRNGSWGGAIPVDLYKVASIRLLGDSPGTSCRPLSREASAKGIDPPKVVSD